MKRNLTIIGLLLVILMAGNACHSRWHDRNEMKDSGRMMRMGMHFRHMGMPGMRANMGNGMMRGMRPGMRFGNRGGMGRMPMDSTGIMPMGQGRWMLESIPNVTENQKKLIEDLMKKHTDEMKKLREEMSSKMQSLMDSHKKDILSVLTEEQKKFIESGKDKDGSAPERGK
jgi:hypothetical protein